MWHLESKEYVLVNLGSGEGERAKTAVCKIKENAAAGICEQHREECFGAYRKHANVGFRLHNYSHGDNDIINKTNICLSQTRGLTVDAAQFDPCYGKILIYDLHFDSIYLCIKYIAFINSRHHSKEIHTIVE